MSAGRVTGRHRIESRSSWVHKAPVSPSKNARRMCSGSGRAASQLTDPNQKHRPPTTRLVLDPIAAQVASWPWCKAKPRTSFKGNLVALSESTRKRP